MIDHLSIKVDLVLSYQISLCDVCTQNEFIHVEHVNKNLA